MSKLCYGALVICITIAAVPLGAQNFGEITGTVTDATGAVFSGAAVTVTSATTNQVRRAVTNETGNYSVPFLVPGVYDLRAESSGFKVAVRKGVGIEVAAVARIDFNLEVGEVSQQVEVSGGAPLLATENTALGTVIENRRIVDLPLNGRNYLQLVTLSPNVTTEGGAGGSYSLGGLRAQTSLSIAGQRLEFNRYTLDGIENTDPNWNSWIIGPSVDALQEFKVQTGVYSAEFGRGSSQINVTTKAGSNEYHGAAFEFLRNSSLDARQWLQSQGNKNPFRRNQFGFTLGGPVTIPKVLSGHDKLFFMSNLEELRDRLTTQVSASVAPDVMRNGDFSAAGRNIFDPLTRTYNEPGIAVSATQFPGNVIPQSRLDPVAQRMLRFFPSPNQPGTSLVRNFLRNASQPTDSTQFNQRVDWLQNNKSTWFGRFSWADDFQQAAASFLTDTMHVASVARQAMISNTRILSTSTVNEARFAWNQFNNDLSGYFANTEDIQGSLGINGLFAPSPLGFGVPAIGLRQGISSFGGVTPWIARDDTFQFMDNVSIVRGRHSLKFGGEIRRDRYNEFGNSKITGEFIFDAQATFDPTNRNATGFAFADYMLGLPAQSARSIAMADTMLRRSGYYAYVQDDWKITPRLTLNLGVRYENARPWHDKYRGIMNAQLFGPGVDANGIIANSKSPIFTRPGNGDFYQGLNFHFADGQAVQSGDQYMGHSLVNPDNNNFAPRVGLSYSPSNRWTIRTGGGVFYVQDTANPTFDMGRNQAGRDLYIASNEQRSAVLSDPWALERANARCTGWSGPCLVRPQVLGYIQGSRTPYVDQWMLNIQRELTGNLVLEAGYLGNEGHKLGRFRLYNQPVVKSGASDTRTVAQRTPWPAWGRIQEVDANGNSNYHALSAKLTQRFSKGLTYLIGFTWSKAIDGGSAIRTNSGDTLWPTNSYDLRRERGLSQFDVRRRFVASYVYELPFGKGKPWASQGVVGQIVGGWQLGGILTFADGTPINVAQLGDTAGLNTLGNQPDATGVSSFPASQTPQQFWNIAAFNFSSPDLSWRPGTMGRNTLFNPGTRNADLSLSRNVRIHESHQLQIRFEAFNATNHPNWNAPSSDARSPSNFGVITSAKTMRDLQFALKYSF